MPSSVDRLPANVGIQEFIRRSDGHDAPLVDGHGTVVQDGLGRVHGDDHAMLDQNVNLYRICWLADSWLYPLTDHGPCKGSEKRFLRDLCL